MKSWWRTSSSSWRAQWRSSWLDATAKPSSEEEAALTDVCRLSQNGIAAAPGGTNGLEEGPPATPAGGGAFVEPGGYLPSGCCYLH